ncbi:hypothetical protein BDW69DRAFT_46250 [Aspergillus filifer]
MPLNFSTSSSTSSSTFYSSSSSINGENHSTTSGHRYQTASHTSPDGTTTVRTIAQDMGQPVIVEEHRYDENGRELAALPDAKSEGVRRIEDVNDLDDEYVGDEMEDAGYAEEPRERAKRV